MSQRRQIWIAGATQGIGEKLAADFDQSYQVVPLARSLGYDLSVPGALRPLLARRGAPWGWIHCPGCFFEKRLLATEDSEWSELLDSNLWSFVRSARDLLPAMAEAGGGRVVAFGAAGLSQSTAKTRGPAYFAVKSALLSVVRSLAFEWAPRGVTVNLVSPGVIVHPHSHLESQQRVGPRVPSGRPGTPSDVAGVVALLLSADGGYVTGQEWVVDGGLSLGMPPM